MFYVILNYQIFLKLNGGVILLGNDNLIFLKKEDIKFISIPIWIDYVIYNDGKIEKRQICAIGIKGLKLDIHLIHPITEFIMSFWQNKAFNTQKKHANNIVKFLNYLIKNYKSLRIDSILDIQLNHGNMYLNTLTEEGLKKDTIKNAEQTLSYFYKWLSENFNTQLPRINVKYGKLGEFLESPFSPVYPAATPKNIEHTFPPSYIPLFFEVAIAVAKPIALGIYMQFLGGLRVGEVVNLTRNQVLKTVSQHGMTLKLMNRNLRPDLKENSSVKKKRFQLVFELNNWTNSLIKDHLAIYKSSDPSNPLFVNAAGNAMSVRSYRQYFEKVKKAFIDLLINSSDIEQKMLGLHLNQIKWSTHIGRGTFSNLLAEFAENPYEIAQPRGDNDLNSSLAYIKRSVRIHEKIQQKFSNLHEVYIPSLIERDD